MRTEQWKEFAPFFSERENWGVPERVRWYHVQHLWLIRTTMKEMGYDWPMKIHCSYDLSGHAPKSYHSRDSESKATDFHFDTNASLAKQVIVLGAATCKTRIKNFLGIGVYPGWNNPGFHLDSRGYRTRWGFVPVGRDTHGNDIYGYEYDMDKVRAYVCGDNKECWKAI